MQSVSFKSATLFFQFDFQLNRLIDVDEATLLGAVAQSEQHRDIVALPYQSGGSVVGFGRLTELTGQHFLDSFETDGREIDHPHIEAALVETVYHLFEPDFPHLKPIVVFFVQGEVALTGNLAET